jgi:hypothetical protein
LVSIGVFLCRIIRLTMNTYDCNCDNKEECESVRSTRGKYLKELQAIINRDLEKSVTCGQVNLVLESFRQSCLSLAVHTVQVQCDYLKKDPTDYEMKAVLDTLLEYMTTYYDILKASRSGVK